ncbi:MAG: pentapeptide repeat-containing protein [Methylovulum sp.]|nr:pentapeptide repeat-containing protein [Methylovulum sp.]
MIINRQPLAKKFWQFCPIAALPISARLAQLFNTRQYSVNWLSTLFIVLALQGKPTLVLATMCKDSTPEELVSEADLIFKGKVIGSKKFFLGKFDITDEYKKILSQTEIDWDNKWQKLAKSIKPYVNAKDYQKLTESPALLNELIYSRTKFKVLVSYKGPILDEIEIEHYSGNIGEEKMVFVHGNLREGYSFGRCTGFAYSYPDNEANRQPYQAALESYHNRWERWITALRLSPHNAKLLKEQGAFYLQYHDFDAAQWSYMELRWHHPKDLAGIIGLADVRLNRALHEYPKDKKNLYEQALIGYRSVLKIDPNNHTARHGETLALLYLERWSEVDKNTLDFSGYESGEEELMDFLVGRNLNGANFHNTKLFDVNFSHMDLRNANFSDATVYRCDFTGAKLQRADFTKAVLESADFSNANLQGAKFIEAQLNNVKFNNADLRGGDLSKAKLYIDLWVNAKINKTKFTDAKACGFPETTWPVGFDPIAAGIKKTCE